MTTLRMAMVAKTVAKLMQKHGEWCLLRHVRASQPEQTRLCRREEPRDKH